MSNIELQNKDQKPKRRSRKKLWIILSAVAIFLILGVAVLYVFGRGIFTKNWSGSSPFFKFLHGEQD
ncbi:hypothetical protein COY45_01595, partial [Candidatus Berkelbacteria bacterium CG_4_10_14_0_8_um_filter_42_34]